MDIKIHGLTRPIVEGCYCKNAVRQELFIMDNCHEASVSLSREKQVSEYAPKIMQISIDPQKIGDVVGQQRQGDQRRSSKQTGVKIDITDDGICICLRY